MTGPHDTMLEQLYRDFNARDVDNVLVHLAPGVDWPNAATGGRLHGHDAVRQYWLDQWKQIDPIVEPVRIETDGVGKTHVRVDQLVRSLDGKFIDHRQVDHVYQFEGPFISRMDIVPVAEGDDDDDDNDDE